MLILFSAATPAIPLTSSPVVPIRLLRPYEKKPSTVVGIIDSNILKNIGTNSFGNIGGRLSIGVSNQPYMKV